MQRFVTLEHFFKMVAPFDHTKDVDKTLYFYIQNAENLFSGLNTFTVQFSSMPRFRSQNLCGLNFDDAILISLFPRNDRLLPERQLR